MLRTIAFVQAVWRGMFVKPAAAKAARAMRASRGRCDVLPIYRLARGRGPGAGGEGKRPRRRRGGRPWRSRAPRGRREINEDGEAGDAPGAEKAHPEEPGEECARGGPERVQGVEEADGLPDLPQVPGEVPRERGQGRAHEARRHEEDRGGEEDPEDEEERRLRLALVKPVEPREERARRAHGQGDEEACDADEEREHAVEPERVRGAVGKAPSESRSRAPARP